MGSASEKRSPGRPKKAAGDKGETFSVRLVPDLRARLEAAAEQEGRSLSAEIVWRLEKSFDVDLTYQLIDRRLDEISELDRRVSELRQRQTEMLRQAEEILVDVATSDVHARSLIDQANGEIQKYLDIAERQRSRIEAEVESLLEDLGQRAKATPRGEQE